MIDHFPPTPLLPSSPDPTVTAIITVLIRYALMIISVLGVSTEKFTDSKIQVLASAAAGLGTVVWALYNKYAEYRHVHNVAIVNAAAPAGSTPVQPSRGLLTS